MDITQQAEPMAKVHFRPLTQIIFLVVHMDLVITLVAILTPGLSVIGERVPTLAHPIQATLAQDIRVVVSIRVIPCKAMGVIMELLCRSIPPMENLTVQVITTPVTTSTKLHKNTGPEIILGPHL